MGGAASAPLSQEFLRHSAHTLPWRFLVPCSATTGQDRKTRAMTKQAKLSSDVNIFILDTL